MKYLDDASQSIGMLLAEAHRQLRTGSPVKMEVVREPLPSQLGAILNLAQLNQVFLGPTIAERLEECCEVPRQGFDHPADDRGLTLLKGWLDQTGETKENARNIGYWLSSFYLSKRTESIATELTRLLIGETIITLPKLGRKIIRRYPTGGISEKQALLIPALLHSIAAEFDIASLFLIAGLLAHTGGTRAKLSILPGFEALHADELKAVKLLNRPVSYVSASKSICPRDAVLYRARSETGTVEDHDLMVSSIMSKQIAVPSDAIVIDILFGEHSFLKNLDEAKRFGAECLSVASRFNVNIKCMFRSDVLFLPRSIGATTEVFEAYEILRTAQNGSVEVDPFSELGVALNFTRELLSGAGMDAQEGVRRVKENLRSGAAVRSFVEVLTEHSVDQEWLREFESQPHQKLMGELEEWEVAAYKSGRIRLNYPALSDVVNSQINSPEYKGSYGFEVRPGGVMLNVENDQVVAKGCKILDVYTSTPVTENTLSAIMATFQIE